MKSSPFLKASVIILFISLIAALIMYRSGYFDSSDEKNNGNSTDTTKNKNDSAEVTDPDSVLEDDDIMNSSKSGEWIIPVETEEDTPAIMESTKSGKIITPKKKTNDNNANPVIMGSSKSAIIFTPDTNKSLKKK